jgi:hypothetical protein
MSQELGAVPKMTQHFTASYSNHAGERCRAGDPSVSEPPLFNGVARDGR